MSRTPSPTLMASPMPAMARFTPLRPAISNTIPLHPVPVFARVESDRITRAVSAIWYLCPNSAVKNGAKMARLSSIGQEAAITHHVDTL